MKSRSIPVILILSLVLTVTVFATVLVLAARQGNQPLPSPQTTPSTESAPQTTSPQTASPEPVPPETTAPVTTAPETAMPETVPPDTEPQDTEPTETNPAETAPGEVYHTVLWQEDWIENLAYYEFNRIGSPVQIVYEHHESIPYGRVISVTLDGAEKDGAYYVRDGGEVTLHVSIGREGSSEGDHKEQIFYLTFDDGPYNYTYRYLELLAKYNVKATFFTIGTCAGVRPDELRAIAEAGHVIGCHSQTHLIPGIYSSIDRMIEELDRWEATVTEILGYLPEEKVFRFPGGSNCAGLPKERMQQFCRMLEERGYRYYDWSCANSDAWFGAMTEGQTEDEYLKAQLQLTMRWPPQEDEYFVCLMHETGLKTYNMLEWAIRYIISQGFCFRTLENCPASQLF